MNVTKYLYINYDSWIVRLLDGGRNVGDNKP